MPLIIPSKASFPVAKNLEEERVFIIDESRAEKQDIRPLRIALLNLMPAAVTEDTEIQFFRLTGNTPLQIEPILLRFDTFMPNTNRERFEAFYQPLAQVKERGLDGLIITGANLEVDREKGALMEFHDIGYYREFAELIEWAQNRVTSTLYSCLASHFALGQFYGLKRELKSKKVFGVYPHKVNREAFIDLARDLNDVVPGPHSRWGNIPTADLMKIPELDIILDNETVGWYVAVGRKGREIYIQGHPEYDRLNLANEYYRDKANGQEMPANYFTANDDSLPPLCNWKADASVLFRNWVNFVYQTTNYDLAAVK